MSMGLWPKDVTPTRKWWYRSLEKPEDIELGLNFTLSLEPVVTGFAPAWLDLVAKAVEAGKKYRPPSAAEIAKLKEWAVTSESVFKREEDAVAAVHPRYPLFADCPYEREYYHHA
jgi:hypothetical protein